MTALHDVPGAPITLHAEGPSGPSEWAARWVVDASGRCAFAGSLAGLRRRGTQNVRRIAIYAHFEGASRHAGKAEGHITIVRTAGGWFWLIPLANDRMSVGLVLPAGQAKGENKPLKAPLAHLGSCRGELLKFNVHLNISICVYWPMPVS